MKKFLRDLFFVFTIIFALLGAGIVKASLSGDIDKNITGNEIASITEFGDIQIFSENGSFVAGIHNDTEVFEGEPYVFDINNDGAFEIIAISKSSENVSKLNILSGIGQNVFGPFTLTGEVFDYYVSDIDKDNYGDIVVSTRDSKLWIYKGSQSGVSLSNQKDIQNVCFLSVLNKGNENFIFCASITLETVQLYDKDLALVSTWNSNGLTSKGKILNDSENYYYLAQNKVLKFDGNGNHSFSNWPINLLSDAKKFYLTNTDSDSEKEIIVDLTNFERKIFNPDGSEVDMDLADMTYDSNMQDFSPNTVLGSKNSMLYYLSNESDSFILRQVGEFYHRKLNIIESSRISGGPNHAWTLPEFAFDSKMDTFWQGSYLAESWQLEQSFGKETDIQSVTIFYYDNRFMPKEIYLEFSNDGINFGNKINVPLENPISVSVNQKARHMRVIMNGKNSLSAYTPAIREVETNTALNVSGGPSHSWTLPEYAFDNNTSTFWQGGYLADSWYLLQNFGEERDLSKINFNFYNNKFIPREMFVAFSSDGISFSEPISVPTEGVNSVQVNVKANYIKITMNGKNPTTNFTPAINEVEYNSAGGASGGQNYEWTLPGYAFDNNNETFWQGDYSVDSWTLNYDLGSLQNITSILFDYFSCLFAPGSASVEASSDGVDYQSVGIMPSTDSSYLDIENGVEAQYLRFNFSGKNPSSAYTPAINEIKFNVEAPASPENCF